MMWSHITSRGHELQVIDTKEQGVFAWLIVDDDPDAPKGLSTSRERAWVRVMEEYEAWINGGTDAHR